MYGRLSIAIVVITMILMMTLLIITIPTVSRIPEGEEPDPQLIIGLPGINPIIPIWYGILGLAAAVIVHEFAHGILTRVGDLKIKSLGLIFCIVPIGAFVEPDEEELKSTSKGKRGRIFGAGPATNIMFAILCAVIFSWVFMASIEPVEDGIFITSVTVDSPADNASIEPGMFLLHINGTSFNGTPLEEVEIKEGQDFSDFMANTHENDQVNITVYHKGDYFVLNTTLMNKSVYYKGEENEGKGFLGVGSTDLDLLSETLARPISSADTWQGRLVNGLVFTLLPLQGLSPFPDTFTEAYTVNGAMGGLPTPVFWILANAFYWIFWLNLMVGIFNALPAIPLDGGFIYKDGMDSIIKKLRKNLDEKKREKIVRRISLFTALFIVAIFVWQILGPRIV
jgi:membrane-associated protease RseP (regulator of RpoE activity)